MERSEDRGQHGHVVRRDQEHPVVATQSEASVGGPDLTHQAAELGVRQLRVAALHGQVISTTLGQVAVDQVVGGVELVGHVQTRL